MNNELYHYGVRGMKWRNRKTDPIQETNTSFSSGRKKNVTGVGKGLYKKGSGLGLSNPVGNNSEGAKKAAKSKGKIVLSTKLSKINVNTKNKGKAIVSNSIKAIRYRTNKNRGLK